MTLLTSTECISRYGAAYKESNMVLWDVPTELEIGVIPKRIYCNRDMIAPLTQAFQNLIKTGFVKELKTWDGCFNIRNKRGARSMSLHSWGVAVDLNSSDNQFGKTYEQLKKIGKNPFTDGFLQCFRSAGFDCGGDWVKNPDRMHFQLRK